MLQKRKKCFFGVGKTPEASRRGSKSHFSFSASHIDEDPLLSLNIHPNDIERNCTLSTPHPCFLFQIIPYCKECPPIVGRTNRIHNNHHPYHNYKHQLLNNNQHKPQIKPNKVLNQILQGTVILLLLGPFKT